MNHGLKILGDGTLVLTLPKDKYKQICKVLVECNNTQTGTLFIPEYEQIAAEAEEDGIDY